MAFLSVHILGVPIVQPASFQSDFMVGTLEFPTNVRGNLAIIIYGVTLW